MKVIRRHSKSLSDGSISQDLKDRVYNPSKKTQSLLEDAAAIGPHTKSFCECLLQEGNRKHQKKMRGVLSLARKYPSSLIEMASAKALQNGLSALRPFRRLVEELSQKPKELKTDGLTQDHQLIRKPEEYEKFWNLHANKETTYH